MLKVAIFIPCAPRDDSNGAAPGDEDDAGIAGGLQLPGEFDAVAVGQLDVDEDDVGGAPLERLSARCAGVGLLDLETVLGEIACDHAARHRIVLDQDQAVAACGRARRHRWTRH
jgi:hypothetical protein